MNADSFGAMVFSKKEIVDVTKEFSEDNVIGKSAFGTVYKGNLRCSVAAIKVLTEVRLYY